MKSNFLYITSCILLIFSACSTDNDTNISDNRNIKSDTHHYRETYEFDYTVYNDFKHEIINTLDIIKENQPAPTVEGFQQSLDIINERHNSDLVLNQLDYDLLNSEHTNWQDFYLDNNYLTEEEIALISEFSDDAVNEGFYIALDNLKTKIISLNLSEEQFSQYNLLVNTLMISNDISNIQTTALGRRPSWWKAAGCGVAIAANAVSTYSLTACVVPNPTSPAACTTAAVGKVLALAGVAFGCF